MPVWLVVVACGAATQALKLITYSLTNRHVDPSVAAQSYGLPSLQAALLACLTATVIMREGFWSGAAAFSLVFSVVVVHDILKLRTAASEQREVLHRLVTSMPTAGRVQRQVAGYLDPVRHHPAHVALGVVFGALFALAFGGAPA